MPSNYVSPGAYIKESDWSLYARSLSSTSVGFVGAFNKGDINDATLITNVSELVNQFGTPNPNTYAWYAIKNYLRSGKKAWVVRIADANVAKASVNVDSNVTYGSITSTNKNISLSYIGNAMGKIANLTDGFLDMELSDNKLINLNLAPLS